MRYINSPKKKPTSPVVATVQRQAGSPVEFRQSYPGARFVFMCLDGETHLFTRRDLLEIEKTIALLTGNMTDTP